jgi:hypothetical protein
LSRKSENSNDDANIDDHNLDDESFEGPQCDGDYHLLIAMSRGLITGQETFEKLKSMIENKNKASRADCYMDLVTMLLEEHGIITGDESEEELIRVASWHK